MTLEELVRLGLTLWVWPDGDPDAWGAWAEAWLTGQRGEQFCYRESIRLVTFRVHERIHTDRQMLSWWVVRCATAAARAQVQGNTGHVDEFIRCGAFWASQIKR